MQCSQFRRVGEALADGGVELGDACGDGIVHLSEPELELAATVVEP